MLRIALSAVLGIMVVACPIVCRSGDACRDHAQVTTKCCCCGRDAAPSERGPNHAPGDDSPSDEHDGGCCSCVCGGAVVEHGSAELLAPTLTVWIAPPAFDAASHAVATVVAESYDAIVFAADGGNFGRTLRAWNCSLVC